MTEGRIDALCRVCIGRKQGGSSRKLKTTQIGWSSSEATRAVQCTHTAAHTLPGDSETTNLVREPGNLIVAEKYGSSHDSNYGHYSALRSAVVDGALLKRSIALEKPALHVSARHLDFYHCSKHRDSLLGKSQRKVNSPCAQDVGLAFLSPHGREGIGRSYWPETKLGSASYRRTYRVP
jgi:hypothetical protein